MHRPFLGEKNVFVHLDFFTDSGLLRFSDHPGKKTTRVIQQARGVLSGVSVVRQLPELLAMLNI